MNTVTLYAFEDARGMEDGCFATFSALEAKEHAQKYGLRVIAHEYVWEDSEVAWDFTTPEACEDEDRRADLTPEVTP